MPAVKPWEWGLSSQWTRQDWLGFVLTALSVEHEPEVEKAIQRHNETRQKPKAGGMSFNINRGRPIEE